MKVEIQNESKEKEIEYPCLMISHSTNRIVLFCENKCGVDLENGNYSDFWEMYNFKPFKGKVILENS